MNMASLKNTARVISSYILPRYPFVNALTLLMLLAERAKNENYPPIDPKLIYVHMGVFLLCGVCMGFNMKRKEAALVHAGQLVYMAYTMYTNERFKYKEWTRIKMANKLVGVAGYMLLYSFFAMPKPRQQSLRRIGEILIGIYLVAAAYTAVESPEDKEAFLKLVPGSQVSLYIFVMIMCACALCYLPGHFVNDVTWALIIVVSLHTVLVDLNLKYWTKRRGMEFWAQIRLIADDIAIVLGAIMYISSTKKRVYEESDDKKDS